MNGAYKKQVSLLLNVLPEVAKEDGFAMHGGTAINLFLRNMPRLSVDIDLTYIEIAERQETFNEVNTALVRIKESLQRLRPHIRIQHKSDVCKLLLDEHGVIIKVKVNMVGRGLLGETHIVQLCDAAQAEFDAFCAMPLVPVMQLYGGKLCAALDRQHPRDMFDVNQLLEGNGYTDEIKCGVIFGLVSSNRPTHEMLNPRFLDQRIAFENQFQGMSAIEFKYEDFEATRARLISAISASLNDRDKAFLLSFNRLEPDWSIYNYQDFPSVKWKLQNLAKLKKDNQDKYQRQLSKLETALK